MADGKNGGMRDEVDRKQDGDAMIDADEGSGAGYGNNAEEPASAKVGGGSEADEAPEA